MGVGISRKSIKSFEGVYRPTIIYESDFLEISTPMGEYRCLLVRLDANNYLITKKVFFENILYVSEKWQVYESPIFTHTLCPISVSGLSTVRYKTILNTGSVG